jgi:hypothetical protein
MSAEAGVSATGVPGLKESPKLQSKTAGLWTQKDGIFVLPAKILTINYQLQSKLSLYRTFHF